MAINKQEVLERLAGNEDLLKMLLTKFITDYQNLEQDISAFITSGEQDEAVRYIHSIKGAAANLAMADLTSAASSAEGQISSNEMAQLSAAMQAVVTESAALLN